ncbi:antibiotic biosynthesis monooxygenase [Acidobacteria bacterium ACD]|nr:MAG: antibiotic biosynthesis monooxygenase [Acidobacteriota bacterium]MCE7959695.1 antibiotic biosynthesis monooxygenase [Acidobacteria bacterium ACB2]MDL1951084.1 antibiotic biosynthesis monooxygenase [Acidobacteria bacterium ACD]
MVVRVWSGRTSEAKAREYERFLKETAYPDYGDVEGNLGWLLLRRKREGVVEFTLLSLWESMEAIRRYAGDAVERPKYYAEDRAALLELPERADHYEVVDMRLKP